MTKPRSDEAIRKDIARIPAPGEPIPDMSWAGLFGVAARLRDDAVSLLARVSELSEENAKLIKRLSDQERHNSASRKSICERIQQLEAQVKAFEEMSR